MSIKIQKTVRQNLVEMTFGQRRSENGWFTGSWGRVQRTEQANSCWTAQKQWDTMDIYLMGPCLKPSYFPYLIQSRLSILTFFVKKIFLSKSLGRKRGESHSFFLSLVFFLTNSLKSVSQKGVPVRLNFDLFQ